MKNLLTKWDTKEKNQKILNIMTEKVSTLIINKEEKLKVHIIKR